MAAFLGERCSFDNANRKILLFFYCPLTIFSCFFAGESSKLNPRKIGCFSRNFYMPQYNTKVFFLEGIKYFPPKIHQLDQELTADNFLHHEMQLGFLYFEKVTLCSAHIFESCKYGSHYTPADEMWFIKHATRRNVVHFTCGCLCRLPQLLSIRCCSWHCMG